MLGGGRKGELLFSGSRISDLQEERVQELSFHNNEYAYPELAGHRRMVKTTNFVLCVLVLN